MNGVYVHIPFCRQSCFYCGFHFSVSLGDVESVVECLCREIRVRKHYLNDEQINTIYFGGGTPSIIETRQIYKILQTIRDNLIVSDNVEITLEANPNDLVKQKIQELHDIGINRLSIGIQTFNPKLLKLLNRCDDIKHIYSCLNDVYPIFKNYNIDIIYAIPGQTHNDIIYDLEQVIKFKPTHISAYSLTIEPQTIFEIWNKKGILKPKEDNFASDAFLFIDDFLNQNGYKHYEISNYCLEGFESVHNSNYWNIENKYLGIGPSAHSYNGESRQYNVSNNSLYVKSIKNNKIPATVETLTKKNVVNEYIMLGLRTNKGINVNYIQNKFGYTLPNEYVNLFTKLKLMERKENNIILTPKGMLLADKISEKLFI